MPSHKHYFDKLQTDPTGGSRSHSNIQPYLTLNYIVALYGTYPSRDSNHATSNFIGEIRLFAGNFAPSGFAFCHG